MAFIDLTHVCGNFIWTSGTMYLLVAFPYKINQFSLVMLSPLWLVNVGCRIAGLFIRTSNLLEVLVYLTADKYSSYLLMHQSSQGWAVTSRSS